MLIVDMPMPKVCITKDGYYGNCPMDRVWCAQRNAPSGTIMRDVYAEMTDNIPSWCPIKGELREMLIDEMIDKGEWQYEQRGRWIYAKCNLCGKVQDVRSNYCPNCGAKMDGERKDGEG